MVARIIQDFLTILILYLNGINRPNKKKEKREEKMSDRKLIIVIRGNFQYSIIFWYIRTLVSESQISYQLERRYRNLLAIKKKNHR